MAEKISQPTAEEKAARTKQKLKGGGAAGAIILAMIGATIHLEGGYVNDKRDPGGETNMGVTKTTAVAYNYKGPMKTLPKDVAVSVYYDDYIVKPGFEPLVPYDAAVVEELFDTGVNMGPSKPSKWFQMATNAQCGTKITVDGQVGNTTRQAYISCQQKVGAVKLCLGTLMLLDGYQKVEYDRLVRVNPILKIYYRGWINNRIGNVNRADCSVSTH